jgi:hypothetical protein
MAGIRGVAGAPILCCAHDPPRPGGIVGRLAPLHLDEGKPPALECNEVDLADRGLLALRDDAMPLRRSSNAAIVSAKRPLR